MVHQLQALVQELNKYTNCFLKTKANRTQEFISISGVAWQGEGVGKDRGAGVPHKYWLRTLD